MLARSAMRSDAEPLDIGPERLRTMTADAAIKTLRRHRNVTRAIRLPLLCALTTADGRRLRRQPARRSAAC